MSPVSSSASETFTLQNDRLRVTVERDGPRLTERVEVQADEKWVPAVYTNGFVTRLVGRAAAVNEYLLFDLDTDGGASWKVTEGDLPHAFTQSARTNFNPVGKTFIGTGETPDGFDDGYMGVLESPPFEANRKYLTLRVSGGQHIDKTYVTLVDVEKNEEIVKFYGGENEKFRQEVFDLSPYRGRRLLVRVVDRQTGAWGHINLDHVALADENPAGETDPLAPGVPVEAVNVVKKEANGKESLEVSGKSALGTVVRTLSLDGEAGDALDVRVALTPAAGAALISAEDRVEFAPERRKDEGPLNGPLDLVWSPGIKARPDNVNPHWNFKSPAVLFQQGAVLAALVPDLHGVTRETLQKLPLGLDLDVTRGPKPWLSVGLIPFEPWGHAYFVRTSDALKTDSGPLEYGYTLLASAQPKGEGFRRVTQFLWHRIGHGELAASPDLQRNVRKPELTLFDDWRKDAWVRYAGEDYREFELDGAPVGTLASHRNVVGDWGNPQDDAWFNSWFQSLRTAYGWYLNGRHTGNAAQQAKAERILNLILKSPQKEGLFPTIYLLGDKKWVPGDGWASFEEDYHTFTESWTAYWMLRWAKDLVPERKGEVVAFCRRYADFLLKHQHSEGCIPSWFHADLTPREEYRDFNAETAGSALFLVTLSEVSGDARYLDAGEKAMAFVTREVLPRHRWYDYETFKSCARKPFDFYDKWTAQYPQNNLSTIQAAMAYEALYVRTKKPEYLQRGESVLDYLLLTQQVWNHRLQDPKLVGGFTTQNTDAEWSDARQCYAATLLLDYYRHTGNRDYLERAVAAARSTFAVAPWENWSHFGHENAPGAMTGIHWGTGSAMTSVEMMADTLGDVYVNLGRKQGVGFNACTVSNLRVDGDRIGFDLVADPAWKSGPLQVRFDGADAEKTYEITVNGKTYAGVSGKTLTGGSWPLPLT